MEPAEAGADLDASARPFVGRERELCELRNALGAAVDGAGRVVLIAGEPGIGKTRLAAVVAEEAESRGVPVWWGRAFEGGTAPAFWPWNTALGRWMQHGRDAAVVDAAGPLAAELAHVFPVLREHMPGLPAAQEWESDQARFRLFDVVSRFLATVAQPAGLVVVLDDAQWADGPSLKLLEFIAADLPHTRLLVVVTYRDTEVRRGHPFFGTLSRLAREPLTRRLTLPGLSPRECADYVTLAGARDAADALGDDLHRETNGNPFFLGEVVRLLATEGGLEGSWDRRLLPPGVAEVVAQRLDRLGDDARRVLAVAALVGETFDVARLEVILHELPSPAPCAVADVLERAVRDRILVELDGRPGRYGFAHALVRQILIDELEASERAAWHARIALGLERAAGARADVIAAELVRHFAASGSVEGLRKAFGYACRGAEQAAVNLGWEEAARLCELALDLGARCGALDDVQATEQRLALARALRRSGDVVGAQARCLEVAMTSRSVRRPDLLGRAALIHAGPVPEFGRVEPETRAILEEACRAATGVDEALRARLYARLASDLIATNDLEHTDRAVALSDEAARAAERAGDPGALAQAFMCSFYTQILRMQSPSATSSVAVPGLREIMELAESGGDLELAAQVRHTRAVSMFAIGEAERFWAEVDAVATVAAASRVPEALWLADALAAMRAIVEGRFADARGLMDRAHATGRRMQLTNAVGVHMSQEVMWHALQGRLPVILPALVDFVDRHPSGPGWAPMRGLARLFSGDETGARAEWGALLSAGFGAAERGVYWRTYLAGLAGLCVYLRDRDTAPVLYDLVSQQREPWTIDGCTSLGPWALALGALARLCERPVEAAAHLEEAIRLGQRMRSRPIVAEAQSQLAAVWLSSDPDASTRARALDVLAEAEQVGRELDMVGVLGRVERLRETLRCMPPAVEKNVFRCDGDFWTVRYAGTNARLKDGKGMRYLGALLAAPGREFHVLHLAAAGAGMATAAEAAPEEPVGGPEQTLSDAPDARARHEYQTRLGDLQAELDEAERFSDLGRTERLRAEIDQLMGELRTRLSSHAQNGRGPAERARKAVTKVLRAQIGKLLDDHPALGRHLTETVRMGTFCVYAPAGRIDWQT